MNKVFLLIVVTALLRAPGFAQTPEASPTPDQINTPAAAAPAPVATTTTPAQPVVTPTAPTAPPAPAVVTPAPTVAPVVTPVAPIAPSIPPAPTAVAPPAAAGTVNVPAEPTAASSPRSARLAASLGKQSAKHAADTTKSPVNASSSLAAAADTPAPETTSPAAAASSSSEIASAPAVVAPVRTSTAKGWSTWLLISFAVLVMVVGTLVPFLSRWRKRRLVEQTGEQNLSFSKEASSDQGERDQPVEPKAAWDERGGTILD
jgi:hypothetical protein